MKDALDKISKAYNIADITKINPVLVFGTAELMNAIKDLKINVVSIKESRRR